MRDSISLEENVYTFFMCLGYAGTTSSSFASTDSIYFDNLQRATCATSTIYAILSLRLLLKNKDPQFSLRHNYLTFWIVLHNAPSWIAIVIPGYYLPPCWHFPYLLLVIILHSLLNIFSSTTVIETPRPHIDLFTSTIFSTPAISRSAMLITNGSTIKRSCFLSIFIGWQ